MLRWKISKRKTGVNIPIQWSSQSFTLREILSRFKLPCLVQCSYDSCAIGWTEFDFNLTQPLFLHSARKTSKACVRCVRNNNIDESGPSFVIPEDYNGWFFVVKEDKDRPTLLQDVSSLADTASSSFYVARSDDYLCISEEIDGTNKLITRTVEKGEILQKFQTLDAKEIKKKYNIKKELNTDDKFLVCMDEKDDTVLLDHNNECMCYEISDDSDDGLCRISWIIEQQDLFPITVRHVFGDLPSFSTSYSNVLQCYDVKKEYTVLASTMDEKTLIPLELQVDSTFKFKMALNENKLKQTEIYNEALQMCENEGEDYIRSIKLCITVAPDVYVESSVSSIDSETSVNKSPFQRSYRGPENVEPTCDVISVCETGSDIEEEDAQSEFSFKWGPDETVKKKISVPKVIPPRVFNGSIISINKSPQSSRESVTEVWNDEPDEV